MNNFLAFLAFFSILVLPQIQAAAADTLAAESGQLHWFKIREPHYLLANAEEPDDSYDPFADYSEFDEASEEEADIQFFRHGRLLTVGLVAGMRSFTQNLGSLYSSGPTYGLFLAFFFDLRLALQIGFETGDHSFEFKSATSKVNGNVAITFLVVDLKYYLNTQNLTRGLGDLNPYLIGGFSQVYRTYTPSDSGVELSKESAISIDGGFGIEIPITRKKTFFGIQGVYHYVTFKDETAPFRMPDLNSNGPVPSGDTYDILGILGFNF